MAEQALSLLPDVALLLKIMIFFQEVEGLITFQGLLQTYPDDDDIWIQ